MLKRLLEAGIRFDDEDVIVHVLDTAFRRYKDGTTALNAEFTLPRGRGSAISGIFRYGRWSGRAGDN
jgi:hypothetical protein